MVVRKMQLLRHRGLRVRHRRRSHEGLEQEVGPMTVAQTSLLAYFSIDPMKMQTVRDRILLTISQARRPSNADLERLAGVRLSSVCGRVNELAKAGFIEPGGTKLDPFTRKTVQWWAITEDGREELLRIGGSA